MATIRSYTTIEQSRKLAEILPIESADMYYEEVCNLPKAIVGSYILHNQCMEDKDYKKLSNPVLSPAWSLAALLGVLPEGVIENYYVPNLQKEKGKYSIAYGNEEFLCTADNPIDACYEMIIRLNELKIL